MYIDNWAPECTHLTVKNVTATVKLLHALIDQKPIVSVALWEKYIANISQNLPLPNLKDYTNVPIVEPLMKNIQLTNFLVPNTLFEGEHFIFANEKNKLGMEGIIKKTGKMFFSLSTRMYN